MSDVDESRRHLKREERHYHHGRKPNLVIEDRVSMTKSSFTSGSSFPSESLHCGSTSDGLKIIEKAKVPDNEKHFIATTTRGNVNVIKHNSAIYDPAAPPASLATSEDYAYARNRKEYKSRKRTRKLEHSSGTSSRPSLNASRRLTKSEIPQDEDEQDRADSQHGKLLMTEDGSSSLLAGFQNDQGVSIWGFKNHKSEAMQELTPSRPIVSSPAGIPTLEDEASLNTKLDKTQLAFDPNEDGNCSSGSDSIVGGSESSGLDELCDELDGSHISEERLSDRLLDPARQAVVDRLMALFWVIFYQRWPEMIHQHTANSDQQEEAVSSFNGDPHHAAPNPRRRKRTRNDGSDEQDEDDEYHANKRQNQGPKNHDILTNPLRFACLFRKHNPSKYSIYSYRSCAQSSYPNISRLKEHLYRSHLLITLYCTRCWQTFKNSEQLDAHCRVDAAFICQAIPGSPPEGINLEMERKLRSRKKTHRDQTEEDRWRDMYRLLFPGEEVPSPYFEPPQDEGSMSPDSRDLADYEAYARRELPRLFRSSIMEVLDREMRPVEASLVVNLVNTIRDCQDRLFRSYCNRNAQEGEGIDELRHNPYDNETGPQISDPEPAEIVNSAYRHPTPLQDIDLAPGALGPDSPTIHMGEPQQGFSSLSSFVDNMYLQLHSSDGYCNCPGPCSCASATSNTSWNQETNSSSLQPPQLDGNDDDNCFDWGSAF